MKIYKSRKEMALEAFFINDILNGTVSGGVEVPRIVKGCDIKNTPEKSFISVRYTYQNGYYTDTRAGKTYRDNYIVDCDGNILHVEKALFDITREDPFYDLCEPYIDNYHEKWDKFWRESKTKRKEAVL